MASRIEIVLATRNKNKKREIINILRGLPFNILTLDDFPDCPEVKEDGLTFKENAVKKARIVADFTRRFTLSDDSGLEVKALGGEPGVFSARYAGRNGDYRANNLKLLKKLEKVPPSRRQATFHCLMALAGPGEIIKVVEGKCSGYILNELRGQRGFGYDPLFYYPPYRKTFAELLPEEKNKVSHRYRALKKMVKEIKKLINSSQ